MTIDRHDLHRRWARSAPPLRPPPEAMAAMARLIDAARGPVLLLGVTPELAALGPCTAIDWSAEMIAQVWPGNHDGRTSVRADWRAMPFAAGSFGVAMGDGCFNMLRYPDDYGSVMGQVGAALGRGRIAMRCFTAPDLVPESEAIREATLGGEYSGFHELKWRVATLAVREAGEPNISGRAILDRFDALFPDRNRLSQTTGWPLSTIAEIDEYREAGWTMSFPTRTEFEAALPGVRWVESGDYAMAELCPILVIDL